MISFTMLKSTRRKFFYALLILFIVLGTGIVLYADGWRLNLGKWRVEKVGQIYLRSFPADATITINGKPTQNQTGFISRGTLIDNLLPRTYPLTLTKLGYAPWHENIAVTPSLVAELKYAVLVPQNATTVFMGPFTQAFSTKFGVVTQGADGTIRLDKTPLANGTVVAHESQAIAAALPEIIVQSSRFGAYYAENLSTQRSYNISTLFATNGVNLKNALSVARDGYASLVIATSPSTVTILDEAAGTIATTVNASNDVTFVSPAIITPSGIAWAGFTAARNTSEIYFYDKNAQSISRSSSTLMGQTIYVAPVTDSIFAVLQNTGNLYLYDAGAQTFKNLTRDVIEVSVSPDGTMLAARERTSIEVFERNDSADYWRLNVPDHGDIQKLIWYHDNHHLFLVYLNRVTFLDLDDESLVNIITVSNGILPSYDPNANALYLLDNERNLIRFDFPN